MRTAVLRILALLCASMSSIAAASTVADPSSAAVDEACMVPVGQRIAPMGIDALISKLGSTAPRGEFETTAQYEARLQAAASGAPRHAFVAMPIDTKYITYDADSGRFRIESFALDNKNASWDIFYDGPNPPWPRPVGHRDYVDLVERSVERVVGTYQASNAYGAKVTVREVMRETVGVLERTATGREDLFFADRPWQNIQSNVIAEVPVDPALAPNWRQNLNAAALISPKSPFIAKGIKDWGRPRFDLPKETTEQLTAVIADISCMVLTDQSGIVLARIPTR